MKIIINLWKVLWASDFENKNEETQLKKLSSFKDPEIYFNDHKKKFKEIHFLHLLFDEEIKNFSIYLENYRKFDPNLLPDKYAVCVKDYITDIINDITNNQQFFDLIVLPVNAIL